MAFRAALFAALAGNSDGLLRVQVSRVTRPRADAIAQPMALGAFAAIGAGASLPERGASQDVQLANEFNMGYSGEIDVGSPGQKLTVIFDTGSSNLWVPLSEALNTVQDAGQHSTFDPASSLSFVATKDPFRISYGSGSVAGFYCEDVISIGALRLDGFKFAEVRDVAGLHGYSHMQFDGVVGLGFPALAEGHVPSVMQQLWASGQLEEPVFGFFLGDDAPGELVFGGVDPEHYVGDFHFVDLSSASFWATHMDSVSLGDSLRLSAKVAIVDSGTSLLAGPEEEVRAVSTAMKAQSIDGMSVVECEQDVPTLTFRIGGKDFALEKEDLIVDRDGSLCVLGLMSLPRSMPSESWILGDVFMRKYYVQFDWDRKRMGFALAKRPGMNNFV